MKRVILFFCLIGFAIPGLACNLPPIAIITTDPNQTTFKPEEMILFDGTSSYDQNSGGYINYYEWFVNDTLKSSGASASTYSTSFSLASNVTSKTVQIELKVRDNYGNWGSTTITITIKRDARFYYLTDNLGSVRVTVNQNGDPVGYDDYYPFGKVMPSRSNNTSNPHDAYKFTGKELDQDGNIDLEYFGARYYDPEIGRWLSVDPMGASYPGLSPYNYSENNPLLIYDLNGMWSDTTYTARSPQPLVVLAYRYHSNDFKKLGSYGYGFFVAMGNAFNNFPGSLWGGGINKYNYYNINGIIYESISGPHFVKGTPPLPGELDESEEVDSAIQFIKDILESDKAEPIGGNEKIPTVSEDVAKEIIDKLKFAGAKVDPTKDYNGTWYELPGGRGGFGIRDIQSAKSDQLGTHWTIDLENIPELRSLVDKIKY